VNLLRGLPGHPIHPPLTGATIGAYTAATVFAVLGALGVSDENMATAWWLALVLGLVVTVPTALTGLLDWLTIPRGGEQWRTATLHLAAMVSATVVFLLAALVGHGGYVDRDVSGAGLALTLVGYAVLSLGGWLGGTLVFTHGLRVLGSAEERGEHGDIRVQHPERKTGVGEAS
jgi:uncharacterized membrane protein